MWTTPPFLVSRKRANDLICSRTRSSTIWTAKRSSLGYQAKHGHERMHYFAVSKPVTYQHCAKNRLSGIHIKISSSDQSFATSEPQLCH